MNGPLSLYIHVPFCLAKCSYCAFYSVTYDALLGHAYLDALERELAARWPSRRVPSSVYMGGGTPTVLSAAQLERLCGLVRNALSMPRAVEWTIEVNPATVDADKLAVLVDGGVTRFSVGAQSFDDAVLDRLGRPHSAKDIQKSVEQLRIAGAENVGLDLIAAIPGVSPSQWRDTLKGALALEPMHLSAYTLSVESGTRLSAGGTGEENDDVQLACMREAEAILDPCGLKRYEVSNFARTGFECVHNLLCWRGRDYVGAGPAASSRLGRARRTNAAEWRSYIDAWCEGHDGPHDYESLDAATDAGERVAFAFRTAEGISLSDYAAKGSTRLRKWQAVARELQQKGWLRQHPDGRWQPTAQGFEFADAIAAAFLD